MPEFAYSVEENLLALHERLASGAYVHGAYVSFYLNDPKRRHIHKALVVDRVLHHAIHRVLYQLFDQWFLYDSFSSRLDKGTLRAVDRFEKLAWRLSANNTKTVWILKCDVRKFFDSIDHEILLRLLKDKLPDKKLIALLESVIRSFKTKEGKGIPLGNLTSQLFANIYLDQLDQFVKRTSRFKNYVRYADDFVLLANSKVELELLLSNISHFLNNQLKLELHPAKVIFQKWHQGVDFLGFVSFPYYRILRTKTKRRILRRVALTHDQWKQGKRSYESLNQTVLSYLGRIKHCRARGVEKKIRNHLL